MMKYLKSVKDQIKERLETPALSILDMDEEELSILERIRDVGLRKFCREELELKKKDILQIKAWEKSSFPQRVQILINQNKSFDGIWKFILKVTERYQIMTRNQRNRWRKKPSNTHLMSAKQVIELAIAKNELTEEQAEEAVLKIYFALYSQNHLEKEK